MSEVANLLTGELDALWRFALRLTSNEADAEDLVQRTCVKALENEHQYREEGKLRSWLFRIEHRIWLNVLRSRQIKNAGSFTPGTLNGTVNRAEPENAFTGQGEQVTGSDPESELRLLQIFEQVESLPEAQRLVMVLVCVEGFSYQETAQILEIPIGTVMSRLARARLTLGKAMVLHGHAKQSAEFDGVLR